MHLTQEKLFTYGMWWRIGYGILRTFFGLAILKVVGTPLTDVVKLLMGHELTEDGNDLLYGTVMHVLANHPISVTYFLSFYFIFWGIIDILLSYQLLKRRLWAFPVSLLLIGFFILYELIRLSHTHSLTLSLVILVDLAVLALIWGEYRKLEH